MGTTDGRKRLNAALEESLCQDSDVEFAVIFGSQIAAKTNASSDIDVAVKFDDELSDHETFRKWCFLSGDLQESDAPFVDISNIEALPIEVAHAAVNGKFLCGDEQAFSEFEAAVEEEFEDQREEIRRHQEHVIERIAEHGLHG